MSRLIQCPICNNPVSANADTCRVCGEPDPSRRERNKRRLKKTFGIVILVSAISYGWFVVVPELQQKWLQFRSQNR